MPASLVWFRNDLRLADNPALIAGLGSGRPVVPVYVLDEETDGVRPAGAASRWWLHHSLHAIDASLRALGSRLILRRGAAERVIEDLAAECDASAIYWNRAYDQGTRERDARMKQAFNRRGVVAEGVKANLLFEPWEVLTTSAGAFKSFSAFWRACRNLPSPGAPLPAPRNLPAPPHWPSSNRVAEWRLLPSAHDWSGGLGASWTPGEASAALRLMAFLDNALARYRLERDLPMVNATSRLSPHLAFGEISARQVWRAATTLGHSAATEKFLTELGWREFAYHLLFHHGNLAERNFRPEFDAFPWLDEADALEAWRRGRTGYPIVDAGLRELWATGWMHNRLRMIVASFLTKDLMIDWSMPTPPTTPLAGSGSPAAAPTRRPISASSILSGRARSSIPAATMCAAGCPSWPHCQLRPSIGHGWPTRHCRRKSIRHASSIMTPLANGRCKLSARSGDQPRFMLGDSQS